jgi:hypothetical protein
MKKILTLVALLLVAWFARQEFAGSRPDPAGPAAATATVEAGTEAIANAYADQVSGLQVTGAGVVVKVLRDDNDGSPHQRFLLELPSGQVVLVAHNIDLAPRIPGLAAGDAVEFHGVYEWNPKGGVIHWTHDDPAGRHEDGWLRRDGEIFQ